MATTSARTDRTSVSKKKQGISLMFCILILIVHETVGISKEMILPYKTHFYLYGDINMLKYSCFKMC